MRVLVATTANDGHFGPLQPFIRALQSAGHEVRVAAPESYAGALARAGLPHEPFADAPPELIGPVMAGLADLSPDEADAVIIREVFGRIDAQAGLPGVVGAIERWRPDLVLRESAELASLAAAERAGVPQVHVCIGMHEIARRLAELTVEPLAELAGLAGVSPEALLRAQADAPVLSLVPEVLDHSTGVLPPEGTTVVRAHEPTGGGTGERDPAWGDPDRPLVYVTFGSVAGSLPPFAHVFRQAVDALADLDASVLMTVGRSLDPAGLGPLPANARVAQWLPQDSVLAHATAMLGHGGFGTTLGALAAGVPQSVAPLFASDQKMNGERVAAVGAGLTSEWGPDAVGPAADALPQLLADPAYAAAAERVAAELRALPRPTAVVAVLEELVT